MAKLANRIRFACGNCTTRMEIRQRFAGRKLRCPYCHTMLTVPLESRPARRGEEYPVVGPTGEPAAPSAAPSLYVAVVCSLCGTRMYAAESQIGQKLICPDCETPTMVVPPPEKREPPPSAPPKLEGEYEIYGVDQPPVTVKEVYQRYIPVVCTVCRTRLLATEDQLGQTMTCPDCSTANVVRLPAEVLKLKLPTAEERGEYAVHGAVDRAAFEPRSPEELFAVKCPACLTRLHARVGEAGRTMECPDCRRPFVIPPPPPKARRPQPEAIRPYGVGAPVERGAIFADEKARQAERDSTGRETAPGSEAERFPVETRRRPLPPWPLVSGVLSYPFRAGVRGQWLTLSAFGCVIAAALAAGVALGVAGGVFLILALLVFTVSSISCAMWFARLLLCCVSIVSDTAEGCETLENWPVADWWDRIFDTFYLFNSFFFSGALGVGIGRLLTEAGMPMELGLALGFAVGLWLGFPILLLSYLANGSPWNPFSLSVWGSLITAWPGWLGFYLLTALLWVGFLVLGEVCLQWLSVPGGIATLLLFLTVLMIYCRMLGRLGWYCVDRTAKPWEARRFRRR